MTRDDIIRMAREVGAGEPESLFGRTDYIVMTRYDLERFAALIAAAERERIKAERQSHIYSKPLFTNGCPVCGLGADGKATGYVCSQGNCPTRITCGGTV